MPRRNQLPESTSLDPWALLARLQTANLLRMVTLEEYRLSDSEAVPVIVFLVLAEPTRARALGLIDAPTVWAWQQARESAEAAFWRLT